MNYHNITHDDMLNGSGLRVVLWVSGCSHHCKGCQNPQTWNPKSGILFDENVKEELFTELSKDYISGITFSGGDPLYIENVPEVLELIKEIKEKYPTKTIWLYSGYTWEQIMQIEFSNSDLVPNYETIYDYRKEIIELCDVFVDGEYVEDKRDVSLKWCGSSNQRIIDVQKSIKKCNIILYSE